MGASIPDLFLAPVLRSRLVVEAKDRSLDSCSKTAGLRVASSLFGVPSARFNPACESERSLFSIVIHSSKGPKIPVSSGESSLDKNSRLCQFPTDIYRCSTTPRSRHLSRVPGREDVAMPARGFPGLGASNNSQHPTSAKRVHCQTRAVSNGRCLNGQLCHLLVLALEHVPKTVGAPQNHIQDPDIVYPSSSRSCGGLGWRAVWAGLNSDARTRAPTVQSAHKTFGQTSSSWSIDSGSALSQVCQKARNLTNARSLYPKQRRIPIAVSAHKSLPRHKADG